MKARDVADELGFDVFFGGADDDSEATATDDDEAAGGTDPDDERDSPAGAASEHRGEADEAAEDDLERKLADVQHRLDDVEASVDGNETDIEELRQERRELEERLADVEENHATLLGVYDQLVEDVNPFSGDAEFDSDGPTDGPYDVIDPAPDTETSDDEAGGDDVVSFDDVKASAGDDGEREPTGTSDRTTEGESAPAAPDGASNPGGSTPAADGDTYLSDLPSTYATDVILLQWMSTLLDAAGPAGALEALEYYAQVGWISRPVQRQLETLVSGANRDAIDEDANRSLEEIPVDVHDQSSQHIQRIAREHGT